MPALPVNKFIGNQIKLVQTTVAASKSSLDSVDQVMIVVPEKNTVIRLEGAATRRQAQ